MPKSAAAPLFVPKKGDAAPAIEAIETPQLEPLRSASRVRATIAVTVRLDEERYERLKNYSLSNRITNQDIIVAALDRFFASVKA